MIGRSAQGRERGQSKLRPTPFPRISELKAAKKTKKSQKEKADIWGERDSMLCHLTLSYKEIIAGHNIML